MENLIPKHFIKPPRHSSNKCLQPIISSRKIDSTRVPSRCPSINSLNNSIKSDENRARSTSQRRKRYHSQSIVPTISASSWCILEKSNSNLLYGYNDGEPREVASLTKIMTCIICINYVKMNPKSSFEFTTVVSLKASQVTGTSAELKSGDEISIKSLLYGLMLPSGNDSAWALAEYFGNKLAPLSSKPVKRFISEMNKTARELGLISTHFGNPHGLIYKKNLSSAKDIGKLASYALKNETFREIVSTKTYVAEIKRSDGSIRLQSWKNTNKLLGKGFEGVKTGITINAGPCLCVVTSKSPQLVIVLINSRSMDDRWVEAKKLADWASLKYF